MRKDRIVFMGTPRFGELVLQALIGHYPIAAVVTQPDRQAGRGRRMRTSPVKALALQHDLPILQPRKVADPATVHQLQELARDVIVVAAFGQILPSAILSLPEHGAVNVHASLLPRYRGAAPIPAAILAGEEQTGITIMLMDEGIDTGPILSQAALDIKPDDTTASLTEKLARLGGELLLDILPKWLEGEIVPREQDESLATYAGLLRREDGLIDWTEPTEQIARRCRAYDPWPGTSTVWNGRKLKIVRARPQSSELPDHTPGEVAQIDSDIAVATGKGLLILEEVQLAGKRPLPVEDFVRGQRDFVGSILG